MDRDVLANLFVEQIREINPNDPRSDDELKSGPDGGYAAADAVIAVERLKAEGLTSDDIDRIGRAYEIAAGLNPVWMATPESP
jgi:hypothetical protein